MKIRTPWGIADHSEKIASGIMSYRTPSHGGIHLSPGRQKEMPEVLRIESSWYEEDCNRCLVAVAFPHIFKDEYKQALDTMRNWHPDRYEKFFDTEIELNQSYVKYERLFEEQNKNNFVVVTAWGDWHDKVPTGMVGVCAKRTSDGAERYFLVPEDGYEIPFVIDESRHKKILPIN